MKRKPQKLGRNVPKTQKMNNKVFFGVLTKTVPSWKIKEFIKEWWQ